MSFKYSAFIENTPEAREWLESIGYKPLRFYQGKERLYTILTTWANEKKQWVEGNYATAEHHYPVFPGVIDCRGNFALFRAITAIRDDGLDYMTWYINNHTGQWRKCTIEMMEDENFPWGDWTQATLEELINHFKK